MWINTLAEDALYRAAEVAQGRVVCRGLVERPVEFDTDSAPWSGRWHYVDDDGLVVRQWDIDHTRRPDRQRALRHAGVVQPGDVLPPPPATPWSSPALTRAARKEAMPATIDVDQLLAALTKSTPPEGTTARSWPGLVRAAEHMIIDTDAASARTPHGTVDPTTRAPAGWVAALAVDRMARLVGRLPLVEVGAVLGAGQPMLPTFTTDPTAGPQGGQKQDAYSKAFNVSPDAAPTLIDSSLFLNVSLQLDVVAAGIVESFARLAVVAEAEAQIVGALEAKATAAADIGAAFGTFTGSIYAPSLIVTGPAGLVDLAPLATILPAAGITIAVVPMATTTLVLDPAAVVGYLVAANLAAIEPSVVGRQYAEMVWGQVSIAAAGVAAITTTP